MLSHFILLFIYYIQLLSFYYTLFHFYFFFLLFYFFILLPLYFFLLFYSLLLLIEFLKEDGNNTLMKVREGSFITTKRLGGHGGIYPRVSPPLPTHTLAPRASTDFPSSNPPHSSTPTANGNSATPPQPNPLTHPTPAPLAPLLPPLSQFPR